MLRRLLFSRIYIALLVVTAISPQLLLAQRTEIYETDLRYYNRALELYNKEKYAVAQKHFLWYAQFSKDREAKINATYYAGVCAMELFNPDAINLLNSVAIKYPEHNKAQPATFNLGK